jgi:uncharacterized membrane protein
LEAHALRLTLGWIGRSSARMSKRVVILVDSKAVLGACAKGRSSSGLLQKLVGRISALALALDLSLHQLLSQVSITLLTGVAGVSSCLLRRRSRKISCQHAPGTGSIQGR